MFPINSRNGWTPEHSPDLSLWNPGRDSDQFRKFGAMQIKPRSLIAVRVLEALEEAFALNVFYSLNQILTFVVLVHMGPREH